MTRRSDIGPFSIVPEWLIEEGVSVGAIALYATLGIWANREDGTAFPSRKTLAEKLDCSLDTIDRWLKELVGIGALEKEARYVEGSATARKSNLYRVRYVRLGGRTDAARGDRKDAARRGRTDAAENHNHSEPQPLEPEVELAAVAAGITPAESAGVLEAQPSGRPRDVLFETVCEVCAIDRGAITPSARGPLNRAVKELRDLGATPWDVFERAKAYLVTYDATLTPMALAKHWPSLGGNGPMVGLSRNGRDDFEMRQRLAAIDAERGRPQLESPLVPNDDEMNGGS